MLLHIYTYISYVVYAVTQNPRPRRKSNPKDFNAELSKSNNIPIPTNTVACSNCRNFNREEMLLIECLTKEAKVPYVPYQTTWASIPKFRKKTKTRKGKKSLSKVRICGFVYACRSVHASTLTVFLDAMLGTLNTHFPSLRVWLLKLASIRAQNGWMPVMTLVLFLPSQLCTLSRYLISPFLRLLLLVHIGVCYLLDPLYQLTINTHIRLGRLLCWLIH